MVQLELGNVKNWVDGTKLRRQLQPIGNSANTLQYLKRAHKCGRKFAGEACRNP